MLHLTFRQFVRCRQTNRYQEVCYDLSIKTCLNMFSPPRSKIFNNTFNNLCSYLEKIVFEIESEPRYQQGSRIPSQKSYRPSQIKNLKLFHNVHGVNVTTCSKLTRNKLMNLEASSSAAIKVDVVKLLAPLCSPLTMRPSFWYCSIGSQNKSTIP